MARLACFGVTPDRLAQLRTLISPDDEITLYGLMNSKLFALPSTLYDGGFPADKVAQATQSAEEELRHVTDWIVTLHRQHAVPLTIVPATDTSTEHTDTGQGVGDGGNDVDLAV